MSARAPETLDEAIDWLRKHFDPEAARGLSAAFQLDLTGPGGGELALELADGALHLAPGRVAAPDARLRLAAADYFAILAGTENADLLYMAGRIEIEGDLRRVLKLRTLFRAA